MRASHSTDRDAWVTLRPHETIIVEGDCLKGGGADGSKGGDRKVGPAKAPEPARPARGSGKMKLGDGEIPHLKLVLVGDAGVGKSCLITNYLHNTFTENYEPTVLDCY